MKWLVRYSQSVVPVSIFFSPFLAVPLLEIPFGRSAILYASACLVSVIGSVGSAGAMAFLIYGNGTSIVPSRYRTLRNAWKEAVDW